MREIEEPIRGSGDICCSTFSGGRKIRRMVEYNLPVPVRRCEIESAIQESDCSLREATVHDFTAVREVVRRNGLSSPQYADWERLWRDNPFPADPSAPIGWVLEKKDHTIVGTLSNIRRTYAYNGEPVRAATASAWAIDPPYRSSAMFLAQRFFSQKNIDLFLNTTASAPAAAIFKAFRCSEIPDPLYTRVLFWITRYSGFARALLRKLRLPALPGMSQSAGMALYCRDVAHRPKVRYRQIETSLLSSFDDRFDVLWDVLRRRRNRLLAVRTSEALTWHFRPGLQTGGVAILAVLEADAILGYLVMKRGDDEGLGLRRFHVVDIQALCDENNVVPSLMAAAIEHAVRTGVDVVEAVGFHKSKRDLLEHLKPHHRTYPTCPYLYKVNASSPALRDALRSVDAWDASMFDGDASL